MDVNVKLLLLDLRGSESIDHLPSTLIVISLPRFMKLVIKSKYVSYSYRAMARYIASYHNVETEPPLHLSFLITPLSDPVC
jgi:hypothetical protein